ncbi:MAG TPA: type II methionyl aminopeptidase [Thermoplasmata archaeon]|nr:type II methionyl aminopeptidase [Thermoplasmata archaeon]
MEDEVLKKYRKAGKIAGEARDYGLSLIKEGVELLYVAEEVEKFIIKKGAKPAFPTNIAIDDTAAHFTPRHDDHSIFKHGMVVKLDVGAHVDGYIGDTAATVEVGTDFHTELLQASKEALETAINLVEPEVPIDIIGGAIQETIEDYGFHPISNLTGHGLKRYNLHAGKTIPNVGRESNGKLKVDDVVAIEPFATNGLGKVKESLPGNIYRIGKFRKSRSWKLIMKLQESYRTLPFAERWLYKEHHIPLFNHTLKKLVSQNLLVSYFVFTEIKNGLVSQFEQTILVTDDGCEILTK